MEYRYLYERRKVIQIITEHHSPYRIQQTATKDVDKRLKLTVLDYLQCQTELLFERAGSGGQPEVQIYSNQTKRRRYQWHNPDISFSRLTVTIISKVTE